jgi:methyl-accepting chemotaxis protein
MSVERFWTIRRRLALSFLVMGALTVTVGLAGLWVIDRIERSNRALQGQVEKLLLISDLQLDTTRTLTPLARAVASRKPDLAREVEELASNLEDRMGFLAGRTDLSDDERAALREAANKVTLVPVVAATVLAGIGKPEGIAALDNMATTVVSPTVEALGQLRQSAAKAALATRTEAQSARERATEALLGVSALALLVGLISTVFMTRSVTTPIHHVVALLEDVAGKKGDLRRRLEVRYGDEVGRLAGSFNRLMDGMREIVVELGSSSRDIGGFARELGASSKGVRAAAETQNEAINTTTSALREMESTTASVSTEVAGMLERTEALAEEARRAASSMAGVATSMQQLDRSLEGTVARVDPIGNTAARNAEHMVELSSRTQELSATASEMNANIQQVRVLVASQAGLARSLAEVVTEQRNQLGSSTQAIGRISGDVRGASAMLAGLQERSEEIIGVVDIIKDVADRTNLLALNASILASQAGEHGRGFAVVADEVRSLADKTMASTKSISALVEAVRSELARAVVSVDASSAQLASQSLRFTNQTDAALVSIGEQADAARDMAVKVESAADEQARAVRSLFDAIGGIDTMVHEIRGASEQQARDAQHIREATQGMHGVSATVRGAAVEQAALSEKVSAATRDLSVRMRRIATASKESQQAVAHTLQAAELIRREADSNTTQAAHLDRLVRELELRTTSLHAQVGSFRYES